MRRTLAALAHDFYLGPSDVCDSTRCRAPSSSLPWQQNARVALEAGAAARLAVTDLFGGEDAGAETFAGRGPRERAFDSLDLDNVDSGSRDLRHRVSISRAACRFNSADT